MCTLKYDYRAPVCQNLRCFLNKSVSIREAEAWCLKNDDCNGFSYYKNDDGKDKSCYKWKCENDGNKGYQYDTHDYYECRHCNRFHILKNILATIC